MVRIRLLTSIQGMGPVIGQPGEILEVDNAVACVWADGERAERVDERPERIVTRKGLSGRAVD